MKIKQVVLKSTDGHEQLTTWLDTHPKLKKGAIVSLKDFRPTEKWEVITIFEQEHESTDFDFHRKWDNNRYEKNTGLKI